MSYLLSIIIPTKDRHETLFPVVEYLSEIDKEALEIVIQDNSLNKDEAFKFVKDLNSENVKYFHSSKNLSVIENSDLAVVHATGKYICFIGDDDGVMPYIIDVVKWMEANKIDALRGVKPFYTWPGLKSSFLETNTSGVLKYTKFNNSSRHVDTQKSLNEVLETGGTDLLMLPCLYHGIVLRETLNQIYKKTNSFFPGPSPDMANAIALSLYARNYHYLNIPVVVSGKCIASTGGQGILHKHISKIEDVNHLPKDTKDNWPDVIPKYWTGPTIWSASVMSALERCGRTDKIKEMNFSYLYAKLYIYNFAHRKQIFNGFKQNKNKSKYIFNCIKLLVKRVFLVAKNSGGFNKKTSITNIDNIADAIHIINKEINFDISSLD